MAKSQAVLRDEWAANVKQWFEQNQLWGGVDFEEVVEGGEVVVIVTDYMDLTRNIQLTFGCYHDALAAIGQCIDEYLYDVREAAAAYQEAHQEKQ